MKIFERKSRLIAAANKITVEYLRPEVRNLLNLRMEMITTIRSASTDIDISRGVIFYEELRRF